jgi:hypothetical protein
MKIPIILSGFESAEMVSVARTEIKIWKRSQKWLIYFAKKLQGQRPQPGKNPEFELRCILLL